MIIPANVISIGFCQYKLAQLKQQLPLAHADFRNLMQDVQVTAKLAALYCKAVQLPFVQSALLRGTLCAALETWLSTAAAAAPPGSRAAAAVRQQLQDSQLLQHLGTAMDAAAARLTAIAAAASSSGSSSSSSNALMTPQPSTEPEQVPLEQLRALDGCCASLLKTYSTVTSVLAPSAGLMAAALPAAPAALRLCLAVFRTKGILQTLWQQQFRQLQQHLHEFIRAVPGSSRGSSNALQEVSGVVLLLAVALGGDVASTLQACPAASELLLSPDLLSCLAIMLAVTVLGLDTSSDDAAAETDTAATSSSAPGVGGSTAAGARQHQQQAQHTGSNSGGGGVQADSLAPLTPLSCSWLDVLGVSQETVLEAASLVYAEGSSTLPDLAALAADYNRVLKYQVDQAQDASLAQLLQQLETDLLLRLMLLQLTANLPTPDSHSGAQAARDLACQLFDSEALQHLWDIGRLRKLPPPTEYSGPQLALQLLQPPLMRQQSDPGLPQQQPQQQQQQQQPAQGSVAVPTAALLAELLPLLTHISLTQLQQQHKQLQLQQEQLRLQPFEVPVVAPLAESALVQLACMSLLTGLLLCSVVPATYTTALAAEGSPPSLPAAAAAAGMTAVPAAAAGHSYVLHAQDVLMQHARDIISILEATLRCQDARCELALTAATKAAAAAAAAAATPALDSSNMDASVHASLMLQECAGIVFGLCRHKVSGDYPHLPSPLVLLALAAGPGSQVQRQLHSLLATLVKLGGRRKVAHGSTAWAYSRAAATRAALALLAAGGETQQQEQQQLGGAAEAAGATDSSSSSPAAVVAMLPSVVILGRCCMQWAEQMQEDPGSMVHTIYPASCSSQNQQQQHQEGVPSNSQLQQQPEWEKVKDLECDLVTFLSGVQQWLAAGSTCEQLTAAGYKPLPVLRQLQVMLGTCRDLQGGPPSTGGVLMAAEVLELSSPALCSFVVPCMCNNPGCTSMAGVSELASVSGRSCICAGCLVARYCGRACQRAAWKQHKRECAALRAAAAAGGGTGAGVSAAPPS